MKGHVLCESHEMPMDAVLGCADVNPSASSIIRTANIQHALLDVDAYLLPRVVVSCKKSFTEDNRCVVCYVVGVWKYGSEFGCLFLLADV